MKKLSIGLILALCLILSGCAQNSTGHNNAPPRSIENPPQGSSTSTNQGITVNKIQFEVLKDLPPQLKQPLTKKGYQVFQSNDNYIIVICSGEKKTGGYTIKVTQVEDNEGKTIITVLETSPAQGEAATQVITYPVVAIKIGRNIAPNFLVKDLKGESFFKL